MQCHAAEARAVRAGAIDMRLTRVERRIQGFKSRVVMAAAEFFASQGIESTKLGEICEAADVAKRTLSNHFSTKA